MSTINGSYREYKLDNGLMVALQNTPTRTISGRLRVFHGALHEKTGEEGLAHLLEHSLMTGGSIKYSPEEMDKARNTFGYYNASTSQDRTLFKVDMLSDDLDLYLDLVSDSAFNPRIDEIRFEEEKRRVLREVADYKSAPDHKDRILIGREFYGADSPHIYQTLGKENIIENATTTNLRELHKRGYSPNNMDLILVGDLPKNIGALIENKFGDKLIGPGERYKFPRNLPLKNKLILHNYALDLLNGDTPLSSSASLTLGIFAPPNVDSDAYAVSMMTYTLSKKLFEVVSQRRGLAYSIGAKYDGSNNQGIIQINGDIHSIKAEESIECIFEEMKKMRNEIMDLKDLKEMEKKAVYGFAKDLESNAGHVVAIQEKLDYGVTPEIHLEKIRSVKPEDIREVAIKYLPENREDGKYVLLLRDPLKKE